MPASKPGSSVPGPSVTGDQLYEELRAQGAGDEKAARIANAAAHQGRDSASRTGGEGGSYHEWSKKQLYQRADELDIDGRTSMNREELISALRHH